MGYDMYWLRDRVGEEEAVAAARVIWDSAIRARDAIPREEMGRFIGAEQAEARGLDWDSHEAYEGRTERYRVAQDAVTAASDVMDKARQSYFRLNISGMAIYRDRMADFGMAFDDVPHPDWPKSEDYGVTNEIVWAVDDPQEYPEEYAKITPEQGKQAQACIAARDEILAWHGSADTPGIPLHKFSSNDGWIVLPAECEAAVRIWEQVVKERGQDAALQAVGRRPDYWLAWIEYLRGAARHGGFEVW